MYSTEREPSGAVRTTGIRFRDGSGDGWLNCSSRSRLSQGWPSASKSLARTRTVTGWEAGRSTCSGSRWTAPPRRSRKRRELAEAKNQSDALIFLSEKTLADAGDRVAAADRQAVEDAVSNLKTAMQGDQIEDIRARGEDLQSATQKVASAQRAEPGSTSSADDGIVDAEFEEADDGKK